MKQLIATTIIVTLLTGCGDSTPVPAGRLELSTGGFSYVTPEGWKRSKLAGIDFVIVAAGSDHGTGPNIFVDFVEPSTSLDDAVVQLNTMYRENHRSYEIISHFDFETDSGLRGVKIVASRKRKDQTPLATYQYVIADSVRAFAITCTSAEAVKQKYEPIFDAAMRTVESEKLP